jgi:hypothetical protein
MASLGPGSIAQANERVAPRRRWATACCFVVVDFAEITWLPDADALLQRRSRQRRCIGRYTNQLAPDPLSRSGERSPPCRHGPPASASVQRACASTTRDSALATERRRGLARAVDEQKEPGRLSIHGRPGHGLRFAFYGRTSTARHQDRVSSQGWQRDMAEHLIAGHGQIVAAYFDAGISRRIPWRQRPRLPGS